jgi:hypothetical protein
MKASNKKTGLFVFLLIGLGAVFFLWQYSKTESIYKIENHIETNQNVISDRIKNKNLKLSEEVLNNYLKNKQFIKEKINNGFPLLIYRYSLDMCFSCILEDLSELYNCQKIIGENGIMVLPAFENTRDNRTRVMNDLEHFHFRNIPFDSLLIPLDSDKIRRRYFAVINKNENIEMIFFSESSDKKRTKAYLDEVIKTYFN